MVKIVTLKGSPTDVINVGLTAQEYERAGRNVSSRFLDKDELVRFWRRPQDYVDSQDKSLVIINLPLPDLDELRNMQLSPGEASIIYIPSNLISVSKDKLDILLRKGISCIPQREPYMCFAHETESVDEYWQEMSKVVSLEGTPQQTDRRFLQTVSGLLLSTNENPQLAADMIRENNIEFFYDLAEEVQPNIDVCVQDLDILVEKVTDDEHGSLPEIACEVFDAFLRTRMRSIGVCGTEHSAMFSIKPTCTNILLNSSNTTGDIFLYLGRGAIFRINENKPTSLAMLLGKDSRHHIFVDFSQPRLVNYRTLKRRLLGGYTTMRRGNRVYKKRYHGLRDKYPDMKLLTKHLIKVPQDSLELVVDTLRECGSEFSFL